ncbi:MULTISPECIES: ORF6N domain-containing protein [unclassified Gemella]|uniref:ORF6N domain-containing protein n=1 Tax=unclassified Gemella TaxID=2624949 RepID=UPI001C54DD32|nr:MULTISPECIES: ORF6N domain-containing protein [unclassified Gemella]
MVDSDLAALYQVTTGNLNKSMKRNISRFPESFCFQLTEYEYQNFSFQNGTSRLSNYGSRIYIPYVFTEQGIAMLSAVLKSYIAVEVIIKIMNSFVEMRKFLLSNQDMFEGLNQVELKQLETDKKLEKVFNYILANTKVKQKIFFGAQI